MNAMLPVRDRERLAKLLGMPGSDHSGERDAAGLAAHRLMRQHGLTWQEVVDPSPPKAGLRRHWQPPPEEPAQDQLAWRDMVQACLARPSRLTKWELQFLSNLSSRRPLSIKQTRILQRLYADMVRP